jgi:hypothetical protein
MIWRWAGLNFRKCPPNCLRGTEENTKTTGRVPGLPAEFRTGHLPNRIQKGTCSSESNYTLIPTVLVATAPTYGEIHEHSIYFRVSCSTFKNELVLRVWNLMAHGDARVGKWRGKWRMEWVVSTLTLTRNVVYPALLTLMRIRRLPVVDWTDAPADLNGLVRFAERGKLVSARVPSRIKRTLQNRSGIQRWFRTFENSFSLWNLFKKL